jgi:hypothetical protein
MTRSELAELAAEHVWRHHRIHAPIDRKYLGRLEQGEVRWPNARYRGALRDILGSPSDDALGFHCTNATRPARDLDRRAVIRAAAATIGGLGLNPRDRTAPLAELGAAGHADSSVAGHLGALVHNLRRSDDSAQAGALVPEAHGLLVIAEGFLARASGRDQVEIGRAAAEAAMSYWWLLVDAGIDARTDHDRALGLALEWSLSPLVGHLFGWRGGLALTNGDLVGAVRLTRLARQPRWGLSPGGLAWVASYEARAHLLTGDHDAAQRALDDAQAAYSAVDPANEPPWLYWLADPVLSLDEIDMRLLRDGLDAAPAMEQALGSLPAEHTRDAAWYRAHLATARARSGDVSGAVHDAEEAARLSGATGTQWTLAELRQLSDEPHLAPLREVLTDPTGAG